MLEPYVSNKVSVKVPDTMTNSQWQAEQSWDPTIQKIIALIKERELHKYKVSSTDHTELRVLMRY